MTHFATNVIFSIKQVITNFIDGFLDVFARMLMNSVGTNCAFFNDFRYTIQESIYASPYRIFGWNLKKLILLQRPNRNSCARRKLGKKIVQHKNERNINKVEAMCEPNVLQSKLCFVIHKKVDTQTKQYRSYCQINAVLFKHPRGATGLTMLNLTHHASHYSRPINNPPTNNLVRKNETPMQYERLRR